MNDPGSIKQRYRQFAETECRGYSEAYYRLSLAVADADEVIGFLTAMPVIHPNLFFASIQFLTGPGGMPATAADLRGFLTERGGDVAAVMRSRRTQTNEVGRCAVVLPALPPGPLALVEVGASAGLCLLLDRFCYEYGSTRLGVVSSPVHIRCAAAGPVPLPSAIPAIVWRQGLDLRPVDVNDEEANRWLLACVWADHPERRQTLRAVLELARTQPPPVRAGDLVDDLAVLLADAPADAQLVVFHSAVLSYVSPDRRRAFADVLAAASAVRDVVWISNEAAGIVPEVTALAPGPGELRFHLGRTRFTRGTRQDELLALAHPHGRELIWLPGGSAT